MTLSSVRQLALLIKHALLIHIKKAASKRLFNINNDHFKS